MLSIMTKINTHELFKKFIARGLNENQAEVMTDVVDHFVTKEEFGVVACHRFATVRQVTITTYQREKKHTKKSTAAKGYTCLHKTRRA